MSAAALPPTTYRSQGGSGPRRRPGRLSCAPAARAFGTDTSILPEWPWKGVFSLPIRGGGNPRDDQEPREPQRKGPLAAAPAWSRSPNGARSTTSSPCGDLAAGFTYHIIRSDRRSFLVLAARFPEPPAAEFFTGLAGGETLALGQLMPFARALGMDAGDLGAGLRAGARLPGVRRLRGLARPQRRAGRRGAGAHRELRGLGLVLRRGGRGAAQPLRPRRRGLRVLRLLRDAGPRGRAAGPRRRAGQRGSGRAAGARPPLRAAHPGIRAPVLEHARGGRPRDRLSAAPQGLELRGDGLQHRQRDPRAGRRPGELVEPALRPGARGRLRRSRQGADLGRQRGVESELRSRLRVLLGVAP